ncbi:hypothetical protein IVB55_31610 [Bradyrhizobium sp. CW4]|uniref:hypothetical protein n=1 Tax=Bradyrhizobium sp. CW4 TaxID=2782687 RepID=UPI001FFA6877|nr:hypothetical protein [Bradyrhizobium sp. CW4]MCK1417419.1 hypothetical protein [Bradyrhizobium sp. CW4]
MNSRLVRRKYVDLMRDLRRRHVIVAIYRFGEVHPDLVEIIPDEALISSAEQQAWKRQS